MRWFAEVFKFELRYQLRSPFLWGTLLVFFLIHFLTIASIGVHLDENQRINVNGAAKIIQVISTLNYLAMLPVVVFVATAITRDYERSLASLFFVTPVEKLPFLLGRFSAALVVALLVGFAGLVGAWVGTHAPWLDPERIGPRAWTPYGFSFLIIIAPNLFIMTALFFMAASLTRSLAITAAMAMAIMTMDLGLALHTGLDEIGPAAMADPFGALAIRAATRYWTVPELDAQLPWAQLLQNRLLWLSVASFSLVFTFRQVRLDLEDTAGRRWRVRRAKPIPVPPAPKSQSINVKASFLFRDSWAQLAAQLQMDVAGMFKNRFTHVLLLLGAVTTILAFRGYVDPLSGHSYYPKTSLVLEHFRFGLLPLVMFAAIYYSGALVHRERESGVADVVDASPYSGWIMMVSKVIALVLVVYALSAVVMASSIARQAWAGYTQFEIPLYLWSLFVHNGFYYAMLCVVAVLIQVLARNKLLGTLLVFCAFIALMSLEQLGVEHILVTFKIPYALYSEMNGYGPAHPQIVALIAYWGSFCVLLVLAAQLFYPRGAEVSLGQRIREARSRIDKSLVGICLFAAIAFAVAGSWIFYNTNILNRYQTTEQRQELFARYERDYRRYDGSPAPSFHRIDMELDVYPDQRKLACRGSSVLRNNKRQPIGEFVVSVDPRVEVERLTVDSATMTKSDPEQGFYLFTLSTALQPAATVTLNWDIKRESQGFANTDPDYDLVDNGTYILGTAIMPVPGLNAERFIADVAWRRRLRLDAAQGLPPLGDPRYMDVIRYGVDSRSQFRAVVGTSLDQTAVTQGELRRQWSSYDRRYFEYVADRPIWPAVSFSSGRYQVARDKWKNVALEVYHDDAHRANVEAMLKTVKASLDYLTGQFAPYPHRTFKIIEHPAYHPGAKALAGSVDYPEIFGFITDNSGSADLDFGTMHELSHQWWGGLAYGARMRGRQMLNETLAQYSTLMMYKGYLSPSFAGKVARSFQDSYLKARSAETEPERPLIETDDQEYISYAKGPLAFYALQDVIGEDQVNRALRAYLDKFAFNGAPFPTSRDLVHELRAIAPKEQQELITDLFEKIVLYDFEIDHAALLQSEDAFDVSIQLEAHQFEADGLGHEREVPLNVDVDIALFAKADDRGSNRPPFHLEKRRVKSGIQTIQLRADSRPVAVEIDPLYKRIERTRQNNFIEIKN